VKPFHKGCLTIIKNITIKFINNNYIICRKENEKDWLKIRTIEDNLQLLKEFDDSINYQKIHRIICAVCARFTITKDINKTKYSIEYLRTYETVLKNMTNIKLNFISQFTTLNGMMIEPLGFNDDETVDITKKFN
jgi:hypothetical protein